MDINNDNRNDPHASESETKHPIESGAANVASHTPKLKKKKSKKNHHGETPEGSSAITE